MAEDKKIQMDSRCPRKLDCHPESFCPLAVLRLKQLRLADHELTEEEENMLSGCPWAINHQLSCYCFFKYAAEYIDTDHTISDVEIAHMNNISVATVKKIEQAALEKMRKSEFVKDIKANIGKENIVEGSPVDEEHLINYSK